MARRRSSAMSFLEAFNSAYDTTNKVAQAFEERDAMREAPEESTAFTAEQGQGLEQAARQGMQIGWDDAQRAYTSTDPMSGATQTIAPRTQHTFMGQTSDTAFTPTQISQARYNRLGDIAAKYGDSAGALRLRSGATKMEADDLTLAKARRDNTEQERVLAEAETKRTNLATLNSEIQAANEAMARGDVGPMQKLFNQTAGMTSLNTDAQTPGFLAFDPKTGSVTIASNHPGFPTTTLPAAQWLGYVQQAAGSTTTGSAVDGLNSMFTSFLGARKVGEDSAKTAMGLKKDQALIDYYGDIAENQRTGQRNQADRTRIAALTAGARYGGGGSGGPGGGTGTRRGGQESLATITDKDLQGDDTYHFALKDIEEQFTNKQLTPAQAATAKSAAKRDAQARIMTSRVAARVNERIRSGENPEKIASDMLQAGMDPTMVAELLSPAGALVPVEAAGARGAPSDGMAAPAVAGRPMAADEPEPPAARAGLNLPSAGAAPRAGEASRAEGERLYREWQDAKGPWYMPTPRGDAARVKAAEEAYDNWLRKHQRGR